MDNKNSSPEGQARKRNHERTHGQTTDTADQKAAQVQDAEAYMELQSRDDKNTEYTGLQSDKTTADQSDYYQTVDTEEHEYDYADPVDKDSKYENIA